MKCLFSYLNILIMNKYTYIIFYVYDYEVQGNIFKTYIYIENYYLKIHVILHDTSIFL